MTVVSAEAPDAVALPRPARQRSGLRAVALPVEHGGWSLTIEPVLIGLAVAWSGAGAILGVIAVGAFVARTPIKVVLVDRWRGRHLPRTKLAARVAGIEVVALVALAAVATSIAPHSFWLPIITASPLILLELWFDMRSRSRRLLPELAGTIGIGSVGAAIALVGTGDAWLAAGVWCIVSARAVAAIPFVRAQLQRGRGNAVVRWHSDVAQLAAVGMVAPALALGVVPLLPAALIALIAVMNLASLRRAVRPAVVIGVQQMIVGLAVVATAAATLPTQ